MSIVFDAIRLKDLFNPSLNGYKWQILYCTALKSDSYRIVNTKALPTFFALYNIKFASLSLVHDPLNKPINKTRIQNMKKKKIALLDLGGVVFQMFGKSNKEIDWTIIQQLNEKYGTSTGGLDFPNFLLAYNELTKQALKGEEFLEKVFDTLDFNQELIEFIRRDRDIIIVSDNYRENIEYISKRYHFSDWSIQQIYSYEYEMYKSNPAFFQQLLEENKELKLENLLLIDDSPSKLDSAFKNGICGIQFINNKQVIREIIEYDEKMESA